MPKGTRRKPGGLKPGVCQACGCSHFDPCEEGCAPRDNSYTLCTSCEIISPGLFYHDGYAPTFIVDLRTFAETLVDVDKADPLLKTLKSKMPGDPFPISLNHAISICIKTRLREHPGIITRDDYLQSYRRQRKRKVYAKRRGMIKT